MSKLPCTISLAAIEPFRRNAFIRLLADSIDAEWEKEFPAADGYRHVVGGGPEKILGMTFPTGKHCKLTSGFFWGMKVELYPSSESFVELKVRFARHSRWLQILYAIALSVGIVFGLFSAYYYSEHPLPWDDNHVLTIEGVVLFGLLFGALVGLGAFGILYLISIPLANALHGKEENEAALRRGKEGALTALSDYVDFENPEENGWFPPLVAKRNSSIRTLPTTEAGRAMTQV